MNQAQWILWLVFGSGNLFMWMVLTGSFWLIWVAVLVFLFAMLLVN